MILGHQTSYWKGITGHLSLKLYSLQGRHGPLLHSHHSFPFLPL